MQCIICREYFLVDNNFSSIFSFPKICPQCLKKYDVKPQVEVIPIQGGEIMYYYLYDDLQVNRYVKLKLLRYFNRLYQLIPNNKTNILIIDDTVFEQLKKEIHYLPRSNKIVFMSLFRYNFEDFKNFI